MATAKIIKVKPGITARGVRTAVKDYTEPAVIEELAANSYDADASTVLVLLDPGKQELHVLDNGVGFSRAAIRNAGVLGGGEKADIDSSASARPYLGAYGFGLKASANIASHVKIRSISNDGMFSVEFDWSLLDQALRADFEGFDLHEDVRKPGVRTGTQITLKLKASTSADFLDRYASVLGNLPDDNGKFKCYVGLLPKVKKEVGRALEDFSKLRATATKLAGRKILTVSDPTNNVDLKRCTVYEGRDRQDKSIHFTIYFSGIKGGKVISMKPGLRGIYVRIHGRLLKHSFTDQRYVYPISKWVKFASGLRVEVSIDWLRNEISLSRDDLKFSNPMLEEQFRAILTRIVSGFIQPQLKKLEAKTQKEIRKEHDQRIELAQKRLSKKGDLRIPGISSGFNYVPETDSELAIVLANPVVIQKVNTAYRLLDYNDKAPFDCLIWDEARREFVCAELEPTLMELLQHNTFPDNLNLIVTWSLGKWRVGAGKKGKRAFMKLISERGAKRGHYKLLCYPRESSKKPTAEYAAVVLEEVLKR